MTTYYVGVGGSNANAGTSWALRKLTLNGAEDIPVAAADVIYVGPGTYRELLTIDVSGTAGNPITYIADVTGEHTDGVGGIVRVTGSDNDTTATRANCITATSRDYRTFRGFAFDTTTGTVIDLITACSNWIIEDFNVEKGAVTGISLGGTGTGNTIRRFQIIGAIGGTSHGIHFTHSSTVSNSGNLVENGIIHGSSRGVNITRVGGITVKNCLISGVNPGAIRVDTALAAGQTTTVNNCIIFSNVTGFQAVTNPATNEEITENYNNVFGNNADRSNVTAGANSNAYPPLFWPTLLLSGFKLPQSPYLSLSPYSPIRRLAGTGMASDDLFGSTRPATDSKKSWGPIQHEDVARETTTTRTGSVSVKMSDAGRHQMFVPVTAVSTVFSVYVQWEADYAGTKPQMVIKQPGVSDTTVTATGSSGSWEQLTTTLTPAASPPYVIVELVSSNTASATNYDCFWDDLTVT